MELDTATVAARGDDTDERPAWHVARHGTRRGDFTPMSGPMPLPEAQDLARQLQVRCRAAPGEIVVRWARTDSADWRPSAGGLHACSNE